MQGKTWLYPTRLYPPRRLSIIVDWSVNWFACVQRSTCTYCRIPSHASVRDISDGGCPGENVRSQGVSVRSPVYWCCQQKSSTVVLVHYTYDGRARRGWMHKVYYIGHCNEKNCVHWINNKKLSYRRGTARCVVSVEILPVATQQCRNYLYDKSWKIRSYEVGGLRWADV